MIPYGYDIPLERFGKVFKPDVRPGKKFIKRVEKDLPLESNDISIALKLYNNLNEIVEYDEEVLAFNQDFSIDFLKSEGYLNKNKEVIDPTTDKVMTGCVRITFDSSSNQYKYNYVDECGTLCN